MINNFKRGEIVEEIYHTLVFDDGCGNGFSFPCHKNGKMIVDDNTNPAAIDNYHWCLEHPERFQRFNKVIEHCYTYRENNTGTCHCGEEIELYNEYLGACECPKCGRWYNLWGQELNNPDTWSSGDDW